MEFDPDEYSAVEFDPDEYQKFKCHRYVQKSYVPTPLRAPITTWGQTQTFLLNKFLILTFVSSFTQSVVTDVVIQINSEK